MQTFSFLTTGIIITTIIAYIALTSLLTIKLKSRNSEEFMVGGHTMPAFVVGILMMTEFIGAKSTIGVSQAAFKAGMGEAWALLSAGVGFLLFGFVMARRIYNSGEYTISSIIAQKYGRSTMMVVSLIMIYALLLVNVGNYLSGAASLATILKISVPQAAFVIAIVSTFYFAIGGFKSVAYVSMIHAIVQYLGIGVVLAVALVLTHGIAPMMTAMPKFYFSWNGHVHVSTILAYFIGNIGAIFSTQYIIQAVSATGSPKAARRSSYVAAVLCVPIGIAVPLIGIAAKFLYPNMNGLFALPIFMRSMNVPLAAFVSVALTASIFVGVSTVALAISSLIVRDFYKPYFSPSPEQEFKVARILSFFVGFAPLIFVFFAPGLLKLSFFTRALRLSIAVIALIGFYLPFFNSNRGATLGLLGAAVTTTIWYLAGNPYGIDNMYIALITPAIVILGEKLVCLNGKRQTVSVE
ncbi:sodium:solute symporter family protein [Acidocella sp.]|uniref:sodium:solute symporter family protein n=1 Tax=Acidocella sp. TaxID=50710 RepID=UPI00261405CF|nr:sodium:solute symporter family protein [Acidocella sp.]